MKAEELFDEFYQKQVKDGTADGAIWEYKDDIIELMKTFATLHIQAALKEALESIPCLGSSSDIATYEEVKDAVLNAYPLDNKINY